MMALIAESHWRSKDATAAGEPKMLGWCSSCQEQK